MTVWEPISVCRTVAADWSCALSLQSVMAPDSQEPRWKWKPLGRNGQRLGGREWGRVVVEVGVVGRQGRYKSWEDDKKGLLCKHQEVSLGYWQWKLWVGTDMWDSKETKWSEVKWSKVSQPCPTLCDPMDCSFPGSSVHGIFQAIIQEWIAISGSSWPRARIRVSHNVGRHLTIWATREAPQKVAPMVKKLKLQ